MNSSIITSAWRRLSVHTGALLPLALAAAATAQSVVINEFSYDDTGTDDREFVELFNAAATPVDISGWQVRFDTGATNGTLATVPGATILSPGAYWLIAQPFWAGRNQALAAALPNTTAALVLRNAGAVTIDAVVYESYAGVWPTAPVEGAPLFPEFLSTDGFDTSWSRLSNGHDTNRNSRDFRIARATPGATNDRSPLAPYSQNADGLAVGASVPGWFGTQGAPIVVSASATAIGPGLFLPPSPQSPAANDRCIAFQPGANNGRSYWLEAADSSSAVFDDYVWIDAQALPSGARHAWSIGIRGGTGSPYAWPGLPVPASSDSNGDRGVSWTYQSTSNGHTLYLVDHGDGGRLLSVLQTLPITSSGWYRLKLGANGTGVEARLGGSVGTTSGTLYRHNVLLGEGDVYVGVRNDGSSALGLYVDDGRARITFKTQSDNGGSGCQGNCPVYNPGVKNLNLTKGSGVPPGAYALHVNASGLGSNIIKGACVFTRQRSGTTATESIWIYSDVGTAGNPMPGSPITVAFLQDHSGAPGKASWWAGPQNSLNYSAAASFFVVIQLNGSLEPPLANAETDKTGDVTWMPQEVGYWVQNANGTWSHQANTLGYEMSGAGAQQPIVAFLSPQSMDLDLFFLGAPGCRLLVDPNSAISFLGLADGLGMASWQVPLPNNPALLGLQGHLQFFSPDPSLNALGYASSDRLTVTIE